MTPSTAAYRFAVSCLLGGVLGVYYGFLRPLRRHRQALGDGLFLLGAGWCWVYLGFGVCGGDLRLGYLGGLLAGGLIWEMSAGVPLRPVFALFWEKLAGVRRLLAMPAKKILNFAKILFASAEKWVTIKWNHLRQSRKKRGGKIHAATKDSAQNRTGAGKTGFAGAEDRGDCTYSVFYGGAGGTAVGAQRHSKPDRRPTRRSRRR